MKRFLLILALFPVALLSAGQQLRGIGVADGLPNSVVKCFAQDGQGFVWMGTFNGLARYDGFHFKVWRHADGDSTSLADSHVEALCHDGGYLWIGMRGGIDRLTLADGSVAHSRLANGKGAGAMPRESYVWKIMRSAGRLWAVNGRHELLCKPAGASLNWRVLPRSYGDVLSVAEYDGRHMLVCSRTRLMLVDSRSLAVKAWCKMPTTQDGSLASLSYSHNHGLAFVGFGYGQPTYAFSVSPKTVRQVDMTLPRHVKAITDYRDMTLFATDGDGLKAMRNRQMLTDVHPQYAGGVSGTALHALFVDRSGNLWIGTYREGACLYSPALGNFSTLTTAGGQLTNNAVMAVWSDGRRIYAGTDGGGLDIYDLATHATRTVTTANSRLPGSNVVSLCGDGNRLWMGIYGKGVCEMDLLSGSIKTIKLPPGRNGRQPGLMALWQIVDDGMGHILLRGTETYVYDKATGQTSLVSLPGKEHVSLMCCDGRRLWGVTTSHRLVAFDTRGHILQSIALPGKRPVNALFARNRRVYFSEQYGGLYMADTGSGIVRPMAQEILARHEVESIIGDGKGALWLGTDNGLLRYDEAKGTVRHFGREDIPGQAIQFLPNAATRHGAYLYFGSVGGLVFFNPSILKSGNSDGRVYFDNVLVQNDDRHIALYGTSPGTVRLAPDENFITISFATPELVDASKVRFRYKLDNFDNGWRIVEDTREVSYTNIPPGTYTFLIQATCGDGTWSKSVSELRLRVAHPWYDTWWARLLWLLIIIGVAYGVIHYYAHEQDMKRAIERKEQEKQHEVAQKELENKLIKKNNEDKLNFFANITHELRTPMFLITAPLEELLDSPQRPVPVPYSYLRRMYRNALRLNKLVNRILDMRKLEADTLRLRPQQVDVVGLCRRLSADYRALCSQKDISFCFSSSTEKLAASVDVEKLELIISNLITNAYKYTPNGGKVKLEVTAPAGNAGEQAGEFDIIVSDTGIGISPEEQGKIFDRYYRAGGSGKTMGDGLGLAFVKALVELHGGTVTVSSAKGRGSVFKVTLPCRQAAAGGVPGNRPVVEGGLQIDDDAMADELPEVVGPYQSPMATQSILIIDDEHETVELLERYLGRDYRIFKAGDGAEGLRKAADVMPDLIICDVMMPGMDGFEFLGNIKDDRKLQHIPVIMFTAKILDEDKIAAFRYGADAYITKPVSLKFLKARIESFLKPRPASLQDVSLTGTMAKSRMSKEDRKFVLRCREVIDRNMRRSDFGVDFMASELGMSHSALYKKVKAITGKSVVDMIVEYRIFKAVELFRDGETNATAVSEQCGFNDVRSFRAAFKSRMGMTPKQYVQQM